MCGPTGTGILYGKEKWLNKLHPYQGGGEMIKEVSFSGTTYAGLPFKYEAGTPNIEANIALKTAIEFIESIGYECITKHEQILLCYLTEKLQKLEEIKIYAKDAKQKSGAVSFNVNIEGVHASDVGLILDKQGIAVRTGHHCTQPLLKKFGLTVAELTIFMQKQKS